MCVQGEMFVPSLTSHKSVFPLWEWNHNFGNNEFLLVSSPIRRTWSGPELEMSLNTRRTTISLPGSQICMRGTNISTQTGSRNHSYYSLSCPLSGLLSPGCTTMRM